MVDEPSKLFAHKVSVDKIVVPNGTIAFNASQLNAYSMCQSMLIGFHNRW